VAVAPVREADGAELVAANLASVALHAEWVVPPRDAATFLAYQRGCDGERRVGLIARERATGRIAGVINLSDIVRGRSGRLSRLLCRGRRHRAGTDDRGLVARHRASLRGTRLHRLEATSSRPMPPPSASPASRLSARGFSPRYLCIAGRWRDHERWALLSDSGNAVLR
jgi:ribosomal-protein-alanine N-acetyltransferase